MPRSEQPTQQVWASAASGNVNVPADTSDCLCFQVAQQHPRLRQALAKDAACEELWSWLHWGPHHEGIAGLGHAAEAADLGGLPRQRLL